MGLAAAGGKVYRSSHDLLKTGLPADWDGMLLGFPTELDLKTQRDSLVALYSSTGRKSPQATLVALC